MIVTNPDFARAEIDYRRHHLSALRPRRRFALVRLHRKG
jgi:hypothetical protein